MEAGRIRVEYVSGKILGPGSPNVYINNRPASILGDRIAPHPPCPDDASHCAASIISGSTTVYVNNKPLTITGKSRGSCGHPCTLGSSSNVTAGR